MLKSQLVTTLLTQPQLFWFEERRVQKFDFKKISVSGELAFDCDSLHSQVIQKPEKIHIILMILPLSQLLFVCFSFSFVEMQKLKRTPYWPQKLWEQ